MTDVTRICFVCLGNIVRSPLAENLFIHLANQAGVAHLYHVDSAGTSAYHVGERPDSRMRRVAASNGLVYDGRARQFSRRDFQRFDLIIAMDTDNLYNLERMAPSKSDLEKIHLMRAFDPSGSPTASVPDPYYGGVAGFEETYKIVERSSQGLLDALERGEL